MLECGGDVDSFPWVHFQHALQEFGAEGTQVLVLARFPLELGESGLSKRWCYLEVGKLDDFLPLLDPRCAALPQDLDDLSDLRLGLEAHFSFCDLMEDAADRPHIDRRVVPHRP